jgi:hypothetical protein
MLDESRECGVRLGENEVPPADYDAICGFSLIYSRENGADLHAIVGLLRLA